MEDDPTKAGGALFRQAEQEANHLQRLVPQTEFCVIFNSLSRRAGLNLRLEPLRVGSGAKFLMTDSKTRQKWLIAVTKSGGVLVIKSKSKPHKKKKSRSILL